MGGFPGKLSVRQKSDSPVIIIRRIRWIQKQTNPQAIFECARIPRDRYQTLGGYSVRLSMSKVALLSETRMVDNERAPDSLSV